MYTTEILFKKLREKTCQYISNHYFSLVITSSKYLALQAKPTFQRFPSAPALNGNLPIPVHFQAQSKHFLGQQTKSCMRQVTTSLAAAQSRKSKADFMSCDPDWC